MITLKQFMASALALSMCLAACTKPEPEDPSNNGGDDPNTEIVDPDPEEPVEPTPEEPEEPTPSEPGIASAADFLAFAQAVNEGTSLESFSNAEGVVILLNDIDFSDCEIVPVGNPESVTNGNTSYAYTGPAFKGVFDGQGHCIGNLSAKVSVKEGMTYGLFGVLDGATVKNLTLGKEGDVSVFEISASGQSDFGILAGSAYNGAVIENCVNNIPLKVGGTSVDAKRMAAGVFVGYACSSENAVSLTNLVNNAVITADAGSNTANGATGAMAGGIAGFCTGSGTAVTMVESCENKGDITARTGRSAGIVATMNAKTMMRYCVNRGNHVNSFVNGRVANLTCIMGSGCSMDDCTNYGNLTTSDEKTTTAGMVALLNADNVTVSGGGNYGTIIGANESYHGLLVANFSKFTSVKGCYAGGSCGTWSSDGNHTMHSLSADTWIKHIGTYSDANFAKITEISSPWGDGGASEEELPDLKDASLRILFIGNSFTKDAVEHLPGIISAAGISDVTLAHCYYGGRTIPEYYADREVANNTLYYANPGESKWTTASQKASIKAVAESGRWDIVTIQEHTGNYRAWSWTSEEKSAIDNLITYVCATQTSKPKVGYILSQAYYNMSKIGSGSTSYITWSDQAGMYSVIVAQARKVMDECAVDEILATGTMLQNLRTSKLDNDMNLTRDGYHMDYGISRYGAACLMYEKLLYPKFNIALDNNSYRYSTSNTTDGSYSTPVTDANAPIALQAARYAVEKPYEVTSMAEQGTDPEPDPGDGLAGSGTASDPYKVGSAADMKLIADYLAEKVTTYFVLSSDIDMSGVSDWTPVNTANKAMNIDFDGAGHTISNFTCKDVNYASLFGLISGSVRNLNIDKASVSHSSQCGILATWLGNNGTAADNVLAATVENVNITNSSLTMTGTSAYAQGMISANAGSSTVRNCSVSGKVVSQFKGGKWCYVGGIVGRNYVSCTIEGCSFDGDITSAGAYGFAGITGGSAKDVPLVIRNCSSTGTITGASYSGGIVADLCAGSSVTDCFSGMTMSGVYNLGGIVARASNAANPNSAGTFNTDINITVSGCIAWNPSLTSTSASSETPATHYSSGAVVGFTTYINTLKNCVRRPDMKFNMYSIEAYNSLADTPDTSKDAPLVKPGEETFLCPYNGTATQSGTSASSAANSLSWDESLWDLSGDTPVLK